MGKIKNKDNFRVVIYPRKYWLFRYPKTEEENRYKESCEEILDRVKESKYIMERTINAEVEFDIEAVCQYCGYKWRDDSDEDYANDPNYNGGCCDADEAAHQEYLQRTRIEAGVEIPPAAELDLIQTHLQQMEEDIEGLIRKLDGDE